MALVQRARRKLDRVFRSDQLQTFEAGWKLMSELGVSREERFRVFIEPRASKNTTLSFVLADGCFVYDKIVNEMLYEPLPSARSIEFVERTTFNSFLEAFEALDHYLISKGVIDWFDRVLKRLYDVDVSHFED